MSGPFPDPSSPDAAVFVISVAAELTGLHPQTLRTYERMGPVSYTHLTLPTILRV